MVVQNKDQMTSIERWDLTTNFKEPDRVPVAPLNLYLTPYYSKPRLTTHEFLLDFPKAFEAMAKVWELTERPDSFVPPFVSVAHWTLLGPLLGFSRWFADWNIPNWNFEDPRYNIPNYIEKPLFEDYDELMDKGLAPLMFSKGVMNPTTKAQTIDEILDFNFRKIPQFIQLTQEYVQKYQVPTHVGAASMVPFDQISFLRGMTGTAIDLYRNPDKIKELSDWFVDYQCAIGKQVATLMNPDKAPGAERVFFWAGRSSATFLSPEIWDEFVYPYVKKIVDNYVKNGFVAYLHWDGDYTPMLEKMRELAKGLPKGRIIADFEKTDMKKAKEILEDKISLYGNIPSSLLIHGSPQQVDEACKKLIEDCMEGGGFILGTECETPYNAKLENMIAMSRSVKKYGYYRK
jgi:uroporphyrinogen-III decarboxylase